MEFINENFYENFYENTYGDFHGDFCEDFYGYFREGVDFAYWWCFIGKGLRLQPAQQARLSFISDLTFIVPQGEYGEYIMYRVRPLLEQN